MLDERRKIMEYLVILDHREIMEVLNYIQELMARRATGEVKR